MSSLNLLSKQDKANLSQMVVVRLLYAVVASLVIWALIFGTVVFAAKQYLVIQNNAIEERINSARSFEGVEAAQAFEDRITSLNQTLAAVDKVRNSQQHDPLELIERIAPMVPPGAQLNSLTFSQQSGVILINGHAALREQVIELQERLEAVEEFEEVKSPLSNLVQATEVDFRFDITLAQPE